MHQSSSASASRTYRKNTADVVILPKFNFGVPDLGSGPWQEFEEMFDTFKCSKCNDFSIHKDFCIACGEGITANLSGAYNAWHVWKAHREAIHSAFNVTQLFESTNTGIGARTVLHPFPGPIGTLSLSAASVHMSPGSVMATPPTCPDRKRRNDVSANASEEGTTAFYARRSKRLANINPYRDVSAARAAPSPVDEAASTSVQLEQRQYWQAVAQQAIETISTGSIEALPYVCAYGSCDEEVDYPPTTMCPKHIEEFHRVTQENVTDVANVTAVTAAETLAKLI